MFDAITFRKDQAEAGQYFGPEHRKIHMDFSLEGPKAGYVFTHKDGTKRLVHQVVFPLFSLTKDTEIVKRVIERSKEQPDVILQEYEVVQTPGSMGREKLPYVLYSDPKPGSVFERCDAAEWDKWQADVTEIHEQVRVGISKTESDKLLATMRIKLGQNKTGQIADKQELAALKAEKEATSAKSK